MKKGLNFLLAFSCSLGLTSCLKDWECQCKTYQNSDGSLVSVTTNTLEKLKQSDAESLCHDENGSVGGFTTDCELK